ncbi:unnamed protein product [Protopolystoma xenopodis]|uniref:Uncharacterized protein n=1 Tax=Protopolystoma xenopodis TaxID=117903 RepID=A0A3S5CNU4_9PLAT|nr:unnamed protein product [Protopolystoma xenopodis]
MPLNHTVFPPTHGLDPQLQETCSYSYSPGLLAPSVIVELPSSHANSLSSLPSTPSRHCVPNPTARINLGDDLSNNEDFHSRGTVGPLSPEFSYSECDNSSAIQCPFFVASDSAISLLPSMPRARIRRLRPEGVVNRRYVIHPSKSTGIFGLSSLLTAPSPGLLLFSSPKCSTGHAIHCRPYFSESSSSSSSSLYIPGELNAPTCIVSSDFVFAEHKFCRLRSRSTIHDQSKPLIDVGHT